MSVIISLWIYQLHCSENNNHVKVTVVSPATFFINFITILNGCHGVIRINDPVTQPVTLPVKEMSYFKIFCHATPMRNLSSIRIFAVMLSVVIIP